ncbi:RE2 [Symbiodinium necroappetens]|uniref:RE2 protein n=1 Tax=Symbiodinium necroappetens TaxID=1628268 RepID=A0A812WJZ6_9DINO|nr:RE2 [Symbiodinium necroappetens]
MRSWSGQEREAQGASWEWSWSSWSGNDWGQDPWSSYLDVHRPNWRHFEAPRAAPRGYSNWSERSERSEESVSSNGPEDDEVPFPRLLSRRENSPEPKPKTMVWTRAQRGGLASGTIRQEERRPLQVDPPQDRRPAQDDGDNTRLRELAGGCQGQVMPTVTAIPSEGGEGKNERKASEGQGGGSYLKLHSSFPPEFRARPGESWKDYWRAVEFWLASEGTNLPPAVRSSRLMQQQKERAAKIVAHLTVEDVACEDGVMIIKREMEKSPIIRLLEHKEVDRRRQKFMKLARHPGESLESFINRASIYRHENDQSQSYKVGSKFYLGHLLDAAKLTRKDEALIKTAAGGLNDEGKVVNAMLELADQLEGAPGVSIGRGEPDLPDDDEFLVQKNRRGGDREERHAPRSFRPFKRLASRDKKSGKYKKWRQVFHAILEDDTDDSEEARSSPSEADDDDKGHNDEEDESSSSKSEVDPEGSTPAEIFAQEYKAKRRVNELKQMRQFFQKGSNQDKTRAWVKEQQKKEPCFLCNKLGHWSQECPLRKRGNGRASHSVNVTAGPYSEDPGQWSLLEAMAGYMSGEPSAGSSAMHGCFATNLVDSTLKDHEVVWSMRELHSSLILDLGCMKSVAGTKWVNQHIQRLKSEGRWMKAVKATVLGVQVILRLSVVKNYGLFQTFGGHYALSIAEFTDSMPPVHDPPVPLQLEAIKGLNVLLVLDREIPSAMVLTSKDRAPRPAEASRVSRHAMNSGDTDDDQFSQALSGGWDKVETPTPTESPRLRRPRSAMRKPKFRDRVARSKSGDKARSKSAESNRVRTKADRGINRKTMKPSGARMSSSPAPKTPSSIDGKDKRTKAMLEAQAEELEGLLRGYMHPKSIATPGSKATKAYWVQRVADLHEEWMNCSCNRDYHMEAADKQSGSGEEDSEESLQIMDEVEVVEEKPRKKKESPSRATSSTTRSAKPGPTSKGKTPMKLHALTDHEAPFPSLPFPSLSNKFSDDLVINLMLSLQGQLFAFKWKMFVWMVRIREAVRREFGSAAKWKRNPRWMMLLLGRQLGAMWGHLGAATIRDGRKPSRGLEQKLKCGVSRGARNVGLLTLVAACNVEWVVMEIFPTSAPLHRVEGPGQWKGLGPLWDKPGPPNAKQCAHILEQVRRAKPDVVMIGPPAGPWSPWWQGSAKETMQQKVKYWPMWRLIWDVWQHQSEHHRLVLLQMPGKMKPPDPDEMRRLHFEYYRDGKHGHDPGLYAQDGARDGANIVRENIKKLKEKLRTPMAARSAGSDGYDCMSQECSSDVAWEAVPVEVEQSPEGLLRHRLGEATGSQFDYIYFEGASGSLSRDLRSTLAKLHVALGHVSAEKLKRMLHLHGAKDHILRAVTDMRCQVCQSVTAPRPCPRAAYDKPQRFNERVVTDVFFIWDANKTKYAVVHAVDAFSLYQVATLMPTAKSDLVAHFLKNYWVGIFGPPEVLMSDAGTEYAADTEALMRAYDVFHEMVPPSAKWRMGLAERHGAILKLLVMKTMYAVTAKGYSETKECVVAATAARNRQARVSGFSPTQIVLGKDVAIPSSLHFKCVLNQDLSFDEARHRNEQIRQAAAQAFIWMDGHETLRKALNAKSRSPKMEMLYEGATVYFYDPPDSRKGLPRRLRDQIAWMGPAVVAAIERRDGSIRRVWVRYRNKLKGLPLEFIRLTALEEVEASKICQDALREVERELEGGRPNIEEIEPAPENDGEQLEPREMSDDEEPDSADDPPPEGLYDRVSALGDVPAQLHRDKRFDAPGGSMSRVFEFKKMVLLEPQIPFLLLRQKFQLEFKKVVLQPQIPFLLLLRLEFRWKSLSPEWQQAFVDPLKKAIDVYIDNGALDSVPLGKPIDPQKILPSRFVLTNESDLGGLEHATLKARWVLAGHLDKEAGQYATEAPTASLVAHNVVCFVSTQMGWPMKYADISAAFLQGEKLQAERVVYIKLPKGYPEAISEHLLARLGAQKGGSIRSDLVRLMKGGFGLAESPRLWYLRLRRGLLEIGLKELKLSPGTFVLHVKGALRGILSIHVDDLRMAFHPEFQYVLDRLRETFKFGEWQCATQQTVKFCGRWERQCQETFKIVVTMDGYTHKLKEAPVRDGKDRSPLTDVEKKWVASVGGQLNWMARQGRADLAYGISRVQQMAGARDPDTIKLLNQLVKKAREPYEMVFQKLPGGMEGLVFLAVSDASHGSMPKGRSQGGMMVLVANQEILEGPSEVTCLLYHSAVLKRVVRSSLAAEISQAAETLDQCEYVRAMMAEVWDANFTLQQWRWSASRWPEVLVLDSKTGYDILNSINNGEDKRLAIDIAILKEALYEPDSNRWIRWVPGLTMPADGLTKEYGNPVRDQVMKGGPWSLKDSPEAQKLREEAGHRKRQCKERLREREQAFELKRQNGNGAANDDQRLQRG